jgi:hypothetical protein
MGFFLEAMLLGEAMSALLCSGGAVLSVGGKMKAVSVRGESKESS